MPQSRNDDAPAGPIQAPIPATAGLKLPKVRQGAASAIKSLPMSASDPSLPFRHANPQAASLYASTFSPPNSRPMSPAGRGSPHNIHTASPSDLGSGKSLSEIVRSSPSDPLNLILKAFVPHVAVYASEDTDALVHDKGFKGGLWELLRPFGERISGRVSTRDSNGVTRGIDDFAVRFTRLGDNIQHPSLNIKAPSQPTTGVGQGPAPGDQKASSSVLDTVQAVLERHLTYAEELSAGTAQIESSQANLEETSPYYALYLKRLLAALPAAPHETFAHPVACIIAISSRNPAPIETLRKLYDDTSKGGKKLPDWVDGDYLRYYVLVHDEENDDITRSIGLFEQMKRHLGLHCHLLRLRSSQGAETDDDSIPLPQSEWISAMEELSHLEVIDDEEFLESQSRYIFESDATAIQGLVREMVIQSVVPTMERHVSLWNDQVASRRRGLTGRFMSMSRKWTFGGSSRSASGGNSHSRDNYDTQGFYRADAPEAIIRRLADYAFMLRDWKLAHSSYDLIRADFNDAKAWHYHAAANEMTALTFLLMPQQPTSARNRSEVTDAMLDAAFYSYKTRCSSDYGAARSLILAIELFRVRGGADVDDAGRWGLGLLESRVLGPVGDALLRERLAVTYASKAGVGSGSWGSRFRKSGAWSMLAVQAWHDQSKYLAAQKCLEKAKLAYGMWVSKGDISGFRYARDYMAMLGSELSREVAGAGGHGFEDGHLDPQDIEEESEALNDLRDRRASIVAPPGDAKKHEDLIGESASDGVASAVFRTT